jgi:predicted nucleic acid-binding protein
VILIDTSAWVEFLRDKPSAIGDEVDRLLDHDIAICDAISMEVLAGARHERHLIDLRGLLARAVVLPTFPSDYDDAAAIYRTCRRSGSTVRKMIDCLIGAVAIRAGVTVLHADTDFNALAAHTPLTVHTM